MTIANESVQSTFDFRPPVAFEGKVVDFATSTDGLEIGDKVAAVVIPFGRAVFSAAATPKIARLPTTSAEALRMAGVSEFDDNVIGSFVANDPTIGVPVGQFVNILARGRIWVRPETTVNDLDPVYVRYTTTTAPGDRLGTFSNASDAGKNVLVPGLLFRTTWASAGQLTELEVNRTAGAGLSGATGATGATGPTGPTGPTGATG
jgi:hypothetical protein